MTFQSTFPDIEIVDDDEIREIRDNLEEKSDLLQQTNKKSIQVEEDSNPIELFKHRKPYRDDEMVVGDHVKSGGAGMKGFSIYQDYNVMLVLTDIGYGQKGSNKFYQIQLLQREDEFYLFTKWGRVGAANPQQEQKEVDGRVDGAKQFKKKFRDKTHTDWEDRKNFKQQPGKYAIASVSGGDLSGLVNDEVDKLNLRNAQIAAKIQNVPSNLESAVFQTMAQIWDINKMNRTLKELNFDTAKYPLGKLTLEAIQRGFKILKDIYNILRSGSNKIDALTELSNQFYQSIPQNYGMRKPPLIDNFTMLGEKNNLLTILQELDMANKYINIAMSQQILENPLDSFYRLLKTDLTIETDQEILSYIDQSIVRSHGPTHDKFKLQLLEVFRVQRKNEQIRFYPFKKLDKKLLWHGSRTSNYVGILSEGLRIAPPEAPSTGFMFGKGIYFADICSKSAGYCHPSKDSPEAYLLLCEVALGNIFQVYKAKDFVRPPINFHSVQGVGRNASRFRVSIDGLPLECGEILPNEELKGIDSQLIYNEYVVYDVAQVRVRYLVKVKFIF